MDNYDSAVLMAGDGDYKPLVEEVKRLGKRVELFFFGNTGLSDDLRLACDGFKDIGPIFTKLWGNPNKPWETPPPRK